MEPPYREGVCAGYRPGMRDARYPLAAARTQREIARQQAEAALHVARNALHDAERVLEAARAACAAHQQRRVRALTPPPTLAHDERMSAPSLARSGVFAARLQRETADLVAQLAAATRDVAKHTRALRLAELAWQRAHAEHEVLERHHERFREAKRKEAERAYELELEEQAQRAPATRGRARS